jgi:uncharacterized protein
MNATTGRAIGGQDHLMQSVQDIVFTALGTRVMRRGYGSKLPSLVDAPLGSRTISQIYAAIILALLRWEPRIRPSRVWFDSSREDLSAGRIALNVSGFYLESGAPLQLVVSL